MAGTAILFVCLGNICRSPMAEGIFREMLGREAGMPPVRIDSAGLGGWHVGNPPDPRGIAEAARHGIDLSGQRARQVSAADFTHFTHILAMDRSNLEGLQRMRAGKGTAPQLFLDYGRGGEVPDPYYGGDEGFTRVFTMLEEASAGLIRAIRAGSA